MTRVLGALSLAVLLVACGDDNHHHATPTPTPVMTGRPLHAGDFTGVYDLALEGKPFAGTTDLVAGVSGDASDRIHLSFQASARSSVIVDGPFRADGSIELVGSAFVPRRGFEVKGHASATLLDQTRRIVGSLHAENSFIDFSITFMLERSAERTSLPFAGTYRLALDPSPSGCGCDSSASLLLALQSNGLGRMDVEADDRDHAGTLLGRFEPQECLVSTSSRMFCLLRYEREPVPPPGSDPDRPQVYVAFFGRLIGDDAATGTGRFEIDPPGSNGVVTGTWSTTPLE